MDVHSISPSPVTNDLPNGDVARHSHAPPSGRSIEDALHRPRLYGHIVHRGIAHAAADAEVSTTGLGCLFEPARALAARGLEGRTSTKELVIAHAATVHAHEVQLPDIGVVAEEESLSVLRLLVAIVPEVRAYSLHDCQRATRSCSMNLRVRRELVLSIDQVGLGLQHILAPRPSGNVADPIEALRRRRLQQAGIC